MSKDFEIRDPSDFDLYSEDQMQDPYPMYAEFRRKCPVGVSKNYGEFYFAASYDAAKEVFTDHKRFSSRNGVGVPPLPMTIYPSDLDPPLHARFRKIMNRHFTPVAIAAHRPRVFALVESLVDEVIERGECDLARDVVRPTLPNVVLPLFGVPIEDTPLFLQWTDAINRNRTADPEGAARAQREAFAYLGSLADSRRQGSEIDDVLQSLVDEDFDGRKLTNEEIAPTLILLLIGGLDTTANLTLESLLYFANNPGDAERLLSGELDFDVAIEELVRVFAPTTGLARTVREDMCYRGVELKAGKPILAMPAAGNRDSDHFADADKCILDRRENDHIGFGAGSHTCLGRYVARLEIRALLETILRRMPDFRPQPGFKPEYLAGQGRKMKALPVTFTPGKRNARPS
jgi:cytochrome P450